MREAITVAVDAMGGDNAPAEIVKGVVDAVNYNGQVNVKLVGKEELINSELSRYSYEEPRIQVINASEIIATAEHPVDAIRRKKDSSMVVALNLVKNREADAFVSAGSTGAVLVGAQAIVGRIPGVKRPPLAPVLPTAKGPVILVDCGANVDSRPDHLVLFARMGSIYSEHVLNIKNPKVGIANNGAEEEKGNQLVKDTFPLLKGCEGINFVGSVETKDIPQGGVDVVVCDGFVGNAILKMYEGVGHTLISEIKKSMLSTFRGKLGALLVKPSLKEVLRKYDATEYGGAPMLGLNGLVVKAHGSSNAKEIKNAVLQCVQFVEADINSRIRKVLAKEEQ